MELSFDSPRLEEIANDKARLAKYITRKKANCTADEVTATVDALLAADTCNDIPKKPYRPHPLQGNFKGCFGVNINKKWRVVFRPDHEGDPDFRIDNYKSIRRIAIVELCIDYHKD